MTSNWTHLLAVAAFAPLAAAQVQPGDLVVTYPFGGDSRIEHYAFDGTLTGVAGAWLQEDSWISSAIMPDGRWVVNNYSNPVEVVFLDPTGVTRVGSFPYSLSFNTQDIGVFSDGTIAISSAYEGVRLFDDQGNDQGLLAPPEMSRPFGNFITANDTIWVADLLTYPGGDDGRIWHLDRQGTVLSSFDTPFDATDVVPASDGTLWVSGMNGDIAHYQVDGTLITQFPAQIDSTSKTLWSLAVTDDGLVWASGHSDTMIRAYDESGAVVTEFDTYAPGNSTFTFTIPGSSWAKPFCLGDGTAGACACTNEAGPGEGCMNSTGSGAVLTAGGSPAVSKDSLTLHASGMIPGKLALLFVANNDLGGGTGFAFGDGMRCAGGALVRLGTQVVDAGGGASWGPGLGTAGGWGPGENKRFQVWYQDHAASPCATGFNLSHGLELVFRP